MPLQLLMSLLLLSDAELVLLSFEDCSNDDSSDRHSSLVVEFLVAALLSIVCCCDYERMLMGIAIYTL